MRYIRECSAVRCQINCSSVIICSTCTDTVPAARSNTLLVPLYKGLCMSYLSGLQRALQTVEKKPGARVKHRTLTQNNMCWVTTHASIVTARRRVPIYMTHNTLDVTSHLLRRKEVLALARASRFRHASEKRCYRSSRSE